MSADDWIRIITAVGGAVVVVLGAIGALWVRVRQNAVMIGEYQRQVNGRMDQLLELTRAAARAEGRLENPRKFPPDWVQ